jgi:hypothetical protein
MSSMKFSPRLNTSHHGPPKLSKDSEGVVDSLKRHPQCDGEVPLRCQQVLHTQEFLGVHTGKNPDD